VPPWKELIGGTANSPILDHSPNTHSSLAGERCVTAVGTRITMRNFNPHRMQRALALFGGTGREVTLECGSVVKVVKEPSVYRGGGSGMILRQGCHM
jgi:hypothetical protein